MDLKNITEKVIDLCSQTASYIIEQSLRLTASDVEEKGKQNLVTYVDRNSEKMLVRGLEDILPGSEFLAEEYDYKRKGDLPTWIIDPLDGTTNFVHGLPIYSISVSLMKDGELLCGVIYEIVGRECFSAWQGSPAYLNGKPMHVSKTSILERSLLVTGFPYEHGGKLEAYIRIFKELIEKSQGVRRLGSAAIDLCYVAAGRMEGFYEYGLNPWDVAAGALILQQAGGKVTDFQGGENYLYGKELLATNGLIHDELSEIIGRHYN